MTVELAWTLLWQFCALGLVAHVLGRRFFEFTGALLLLALVTFHALPEILLLVAPRETKYRLLLTLEQLNNWLWYVGPAIALYAVGYLAVLGRARNVGTEDIPSADSMQFFKWQHCLVVTAPLYLVALAGRGYIPGAQVRNYFESGATGQFLLVGVVLTTFALISRFNHALLFLLAQSFALLLLGQRLTVIAGLVMVCVVLMRHGWQVTRRQVTAVVLVGVLGSFILSSSRIDVGREGFSAKADAGTRITAIFSGADHLLSAETREQLLDDYVYRVDGNFFGALVLDALTTDHTPPVGAETLRNIVVLAVPSFLNPGKLDTAVEERSEKAFYQTHFAMPNVDLLPGFLGPMVGYIGVHGFFVLTFLLGAAMAGLDRFLRANTPVRTVLAAGVVNAIMYYERGPEGVAITIRGTLTIVLLMQLLRFAERAARHHAPIRRQPIPRRVTVPPLT